MINSDITIGIDPSLNSTGWAVVRSVSNSIKVLDFGIIKDSFPKDKDYYIEKIVNIGRFVRKLINNYEGADIAMEKTVCNVNPASSLKLSMVRGGIIYSVCDTGAKLTEYEPKKIKKSLVGNGNAGKQQVAFMIKTITNLRNDSEIKSFDVTDAIAVAITHINMRNSQIRNIF